MTFKKNNIPWNKGLTKKDNNSLASMAKKKIGKKRPEHSEWMKKNNPSKRPEVRKKLSDQKKGSKIKGIHWTKNGKWTKDEVKEKLGKGTRGKTYEEIHGKEKAKKLRLLNSIKQKEHNKKFGTYKHTAKTKNKLRELSYKRKPKYRNTKPELKMQEILNKNNIKYEIHKQIFGIPDIFIEPNICIFVDGEYWHNYPNRRLIDKRVNKKLKNDGYRVLRFWSEQIFNKSSYCLSRVKQTMRS